MLEGSIKYSGGKIGIAVSRFNNDITGNLLKGALHGLKKYSVPEENIVVVKVPGAFEIPLAAQKLLRGDNMADACDVIITLGVIIKGDTDHYEYVCKETADGIMRIQLDEGRPVIFEVLMVDQVERAEARSVVPVGDNDGVVYDDSGDPQWMNNKGYIAALNALEMMNLYGKM